MFISRHVDDILLVAAVGDHSFAYNTS